MLSRKVTISIGFIGLAIVSSSSLHAQSRKELEAKRKDLNERLKVSSNMLRETAQDRKEETIHLQAINNQLDQRLELVGVIKQEVGSLDMSIQEGSKRIALLEKDLKRLKDNYANMVRLAYQNRKRFEVWEYLFASQDVSDAVRRWSYLRRYNDYIQNQIKLIDQTKSLIHGQTQSLLGQQREKSALLEQEKNEITTIDREKKEREAMVAKLAKEEKRLKQEIENIQQSKEALSRAIEDVIRTEIAKARELARARAEKKPAKNNSSTKASPAAAPAEMELTPSESNLASQFTQNAGRLPWPVSKGVVVGKFGTSPHPVFPLIKINNNGWDIKTEPGSSVNAVFQGKVVSVFYSPSFQYAVMIQHGDYFSTYSNLKFAKVSSQQSVSTGQSLGEVGTNAQGSTVVHVEIWHGKKVLDPARWFKR